MIKLTKKDKEYLLKSGETEEDITQIEEAIGKTKYTLIRGNNNKETKISASTARFLLGDEAFLSGISRSAFHWTSEREVPETDLFVFFDSSKLFRI